MMVPFNWGFMPKPLPLIAFSTSGTFVLSQTLTVTMRGSGTFIVPNWFSGVFCP